MNWQDLLEHDIYYDLELAGLWVGKDPNEFVKRLNRAINAEADEEYSYLLRCLLTRDERFVLNIGDNYCTQENNTHGGLLLCNSDVACDTELTDLEGKQQAEARKFMTSQLRLVGARSIVPKEELHETFISNKKRRAKDDINMHDHSMDYDEVDAQYDLFLRGLKQYEKSYVFKGENGGASVFIKYEGDSDSDSSGSDNVFPIQIEKKFNHLRSRFRIKLMQILRKPYSREEYNELRQAIKVRRPQECHLELRHGRERAYLKNIIGKSYLDHHLASDEGRGI